MKRPITLALLPVFVAALGACGPSRGDDELMRRVAQAEAAATKAEASAKRAEAAAARLGAGTTGEQGASAPPPAETVVEDGVEAEESYGKGTDPVPSG